MTNFFFVNTLTHYKSNMNYELAKKLKDAGFPEMEWRIEQFLKHGPAKLPTLSELIEACGDSLGDLTRTDSGWMTNCENIGNNPQTEGSTPEEAVANLWLELNKK